ncbi:MAG: Gfo/Idh/MocA family oxidoreductase, partial [Clostridia bacterium]|nr:Gfo/Idh/MocA family oxidoreductase [Clostridia bacterium]
MLKAALVGFGGIAKAHRKAYAKLEKIGKAQLVCAYDIDPEAFNRKIAINIDNGTAELEEHIRFCTDLDRMLASEEIDFIDVCVPSFLHSRIASDLLRRGYHVMCEKPMSLTFDDCREMLAASKESGKELMIGQCLRFYPAFDYIKKVVDSGEFGRVIGGFFSRLSAPPVWGW